MNTRKIRTTAIAGFAAVAMIAAGSLAASTEAHAGGKAAAAFFGGLVLGGIAAGAAHGNYYGTPVYYGPRCHWQKHKVWTPHGYPVWRKVRVCY
ncbi:MAG: hypothetical protein VYD64_09900 [Pseudomonadota bacterium]|nr:hypothetical protein [Pseudomonadota bacterium]